jgi:putative transposase
LESEVEFSYKEEFYMKRSKFSDSQIMEAVKRVGAGIWVPDLCRELGISTATFYKWLRRMGGWMFQ